MQAYLRVNGYFTVSELPAPAFSVPWPVLRRDLLGCATGDYIDLLEEVLQDTDHRNAGGFHLGPAFGHRREHGVAPLDRHPQPVVGPDVRHADQGHVILERDRVGDPFPDHAVPVHGHPNMRSCRPDSLSRQAIADSPDGGSDIGFSRSIRLRPRELRLVPSLRQDFPLFPQ